MVQGVLDRTVRAVNWCPELAVLLLTEKMVARPGWERIIACISAALPARCVFVGGAAAGIMASDFEELTKNTEVDEAAFALTIARFGVNEAPRQHGLTVSITLRF